MPDPTYSDYLSFRASDAPAADTHEDVARLYFGHDGAFHTVTQDGDDLRVSVISDQRSVEISSAQILALDSTPVILVDGVADSLILPLHLIFKYHYGGTAYSQGGSFRLFWGASHGAANADLTISAAATFYVSNPSDILEKTSDTTVIANMFGNSGAGDIGASEYGLPLKLDANGAMTDGNGTLDVTVLYYLLAG